MADVIQFVNLRDQHEKVRAEIEAEISKLIDQSRFIGGPPVEKFEREFAAYLGVDHVIGCANGTDALWLALAAADIGPGDAIITQPNTFIATIEAITRVGAYPVFVDIDLETATMDVYALQNLLETACTRDADGCLVHSASQKRVAAILPVHLYGLPANMRPILDLAETYDLKVFEDAAQAQGSAYLDGQQWKKAGSMGLAAGFSFYPGKNLGAMGDAGAVATNDADLARKIHWLRDHGSSEKYVHVTSQGWNSRLDSIQAVVLSAKLRMLDEWNDARRQAAKFYQNALKEFNLSLPVEPDYGRHIYHLYVIRHADRDRVQKEFGLRGIQTGLHYPVPIHRQAAYQSLGIPEGAYPNAETSAGTILSLPMHQALSQVHIDRVAGALAEIMDN